MPQGQTLEFTNPGTGSPVSGRITGIAVDSTDVTGNTIFIATAGGGVWKTTNGGQNWTTTTDHLTDANGNSIPLFMGSITYAAPDSLGDPATIYAGTGEANNSLDSGEGEGILKSTDGGNTWTLMGENIFNGFSIGKIVTDPQNSQIVFAAVGVAGNNGLRNGAVGVWESKDGGKTWTDTTPATGAFSGLDTNFASFEDLVVDPTTTGSGLTLYTSTWLDFSPTSSLNGIFESTNAGATWTKLGGGLPTTNIGRIALAIAHPAGGTTLYAAISSGSYSLRRVMKSTDGGSTWSNVTGNAGNVLGNQGWYDITIAIDPTDSTANTVYVGGTYDGSGVGLVETKTGGGASGWVNLVGTSGNLTTGVGPHTDSHAMAFTTTGKLLEGDDGGIFELTNNKITSPTNVTWSDLNGNLGTLQFTGFAIDPNNPNLVFGGTQDNGTLLAQTPLGGQTPAWSTVDSGDGGFVQIDPTTGATQATTTLYHTYSYGTAFLQKSTNGGATWSTDTGTGTQKINLSESGQFYPPFVIDPDTNDASYNQHLYLGLQSVWQTSNGGTTWTTLGKAIPFGGTAGNGPTVVSIAVAPSNSNIVYVSTIDYTTNTTGTAHIWVTTNANLGTSATWTQLTDPVSSPNITPLRYNQIAVDPNNPYHIYVVVANPGAATSNGTLVNPHVFQATYSGSGNNIAWNNITGNLPNQPANAVVIDSIDQLLYVGNDTGVWVSGMNGGTWIQLGASTLPDAQVVQLQFLPGFGGILAAATHGRGIWEIQAGDTINPNVGDSISGTVFNDANGNGVLDSGETGLAGWTVELLDASTGNFLATTVTDSNGNYSFAVQPGTYRIREMIQPNYTQTTSDPPVITISSSNPTSTGNNFGDHSTLTLSPVTLPTATVNDGYHVVLAYSGGSGSGYNLSESGTLPTGLSFNTTTGTFAGTPTQSGTFNNIKITLTDNAGGLITQTYTLVVDAAITFTPTNLNPGAVGSPYPSVTFTPSGGAAAPTPSAVPAYPPA